MRASASCLSKFAFPAEGAPGIHFRALLDRLNLAVELQAKLRPMTAGVVQAVVKGEADIAFAPIPVILAEPGVEAIGPIPEEAQNWSDLSAAIATVSPHSEAAKQFIEFITSPSSKELQTGRRSGTGRRLRRKS